MEGKETFQAKSRLKIPTSKSKGTHHPLVAEDKESLVRNPLERANSAIVKIKNDSITFIKGRDQGEEMASRAGDKNHRTHRRNGSESNLHRQLNFKCNHSRKHKSGKFDDAHLNFHDYRSIYQRSCQEESKKANSAPTISMNKEIDGFSLTDEMRMLNNVFMIKKEKKKCSICRLEIDDNSNYVFFGGNFYHEKCQKCYACKKKIEPPFLIERPTRIYCMNCRKSLLAV
ncbi:hypothetical protein TRFO_05145 [Tritrichomonas foetus]|uniref:LIM zinc-binding domain-containing protein n=1 Tax=Tritrichomonas foetus TaxID=1144522 RepID=A0A1J4KDI9_9EUKA|nr:hypothetical protein TRFO_05145 [Tritrichomonas foetus]|eukprot:OHT07525.1 hypothetical protein TRFO_05145 [Tritrichomonas foetus]